MNLFLTGPTGPSEPDRSPRAPLGDHLGERVAALVDEELDDDERDRALAHVALCIECWRELSAQRRLKARLVALATPHPDEALLQRLRALSDPHAGATPLGGSDPHAGATPLGGSDPHAGTTPLGGSDPHAGTTPPGGSDPLSGATVAGPESVPPQVSRVVAGGGAHRAVWRGRILVGSGVLALAGLGLGLAFAGSPAVLRGVDPAGSSYVVQHVATTGVTPLQDPGVTVVTAGFSW